MKIIRLLCIVVVVILSVLRRTSAQIPSVTLSPSLLRRLTSQQDLYSVQDTTASAETPLVPAPKIHSLLITSHIEHRYSKTVVSSRIANPANISQEVIFSMLLPENAFISKFLMDIGGTIYEAYVKEKDEAQKEYNNAVFSGQAAAHIALTARDSSRFTMSVNVEPQSKVTFNLTYEELLSRHLGVYNHAININPGQVVKDLQVDVFIKESQNITFLKIPDLHSGNEIYPEENDKENPLVIIKRRSPSEAHIKFSPNVEDQKNYKSRNKYYSAEGLQGQFVVQYDVDRKLDGGEVLVNNGYFVHFFAPEDLTPLNKHAIFVLDVSGSMEGRKIEQLKDAMITILDELNEDDFFNIVEFSYSVTVWNFDSTAASAVFSPPTGYSHEELQVNTNSTPAFPATLEYISKAKDIIRKMRAGGGTNIYDTLKISVKLAQEGLSNTAVLKKNETKKLEPMIVFLTDGEPTISEVRPNKILAAISEINENSKAPIFSLAFGDDADINFLRKLSLKNFGFSKKIYEAADAALQLEKFYHQIASPLLANVTFRYEPSHVDETSITKQIFSTFFMGSELVVTGRLASNNSSTEDFSGEVYGLSSNGTSMFQLSYAESVSKHKVSSLERLWAYLQIQQLLEKYEAGSKDNSGIYNDSTANYTTVTSDNSIENTMQQAMDLALKYSFVTPVTSLIVVKPNNTEQIGAELPMSDYGGQTALPLHLSIDPGHNFGSIDRIDTAAFPLSAASPDTSFSSASGILYESDDNFYDIGEIKINTTLISLEDLTWLQSVTNNSNKILLPVGVNKSREVFDLSINETETVLVPCSSVSGVTGICTYLANCVLESFRNDIEEYLNYFCSIGSYAGSCCPDNVYEEHFHTSTDTTIIEDTTPTTMNITDKMKFLTIT